MISILIFRMVFDGILDLESGCAWFSGFWVFGVPLNNFRLLEPSLGHYGGSAQSLFMAHFPNSIIQFLAVSWYFSLSFLVIGFWWYFYRFTTTFFNYIGDSWQRFFFSRSMSSPPRSIRIQLAVRATLALAWAARNRSIDPRTLKKKERTGVIEQHKNYAKIHAKNTHTHKLHEIPQQKSRKQQTLLECEYSSKMADRIFLCFWAKRHENAVFVRFFF